MKPLFLIGAWLHRHGWRLVLVAMVVAALIRGWLMWKHPVVFW